MKLKNSILLIVLLLNILLGCKTSEEKNIHQKIENDTEEIFNKIVEIRRNFHENPELAGNEKRTSETIAKYLSNLGLEVKTGVAGYGVIGVLKGKKEGKNIAWRADIDALPNDFPDEVPFKSKFKGIQHGCGHDVHMAIGLGIAEVLAKNKKSLKGTVYFIFQPEEETFVGAKNIVNSKLFSELNIDEIYALHVTNLPVGEILVKPNEIFAYQKRVRIMMKNDLSSKEIKALTKKIFNSLSRPKNESKPWDLSQMNNPSIGLSNPNTIFKDYLIIDEKFTEYSKSNELILETNLYETNKSNLNQIIPKIKEVIETNGYKNKLISISFIQENPTVHNDTELTNKAINILGENQKKLIDYGQIPFFNDDFTYFQQKIPGVYFLLGGLNSEKGIIALNHSPNFAVDEECIKIGVKSFSSLIFERAK